MREQPTSYHAVQEVWQRPMSPEVADELPRAAPCYGFDVCGIVDLDLVSTKPQLAWMDLLQISFLLGSISGHNCCYRLQRRFGSHDYRAIIPNISFSFGLLLAFHNEFLHMYVHDMHSLIKDGMILF